MKFSDIKNELNSSEEFVQDVLSAFPLGRT